MKYEALWLTKTRDGKIVPQWPFPTRFLVSRELADCDSFELRPLTIRAVVSSSLGNTIREIHIWILKRLFRAGFLDTPPACIPSIRKDWTWNRRETLRKRNGPRAS